MMEFYLVYDYVGPNGFIPFIYTHDNLYDVLDSNQKSKIKYNKFSKNTKQILTKELLSNPKAIPHNFYIVLIDEKLKDESIESILSETLLYFIKQNPNNIRILYFNHHVEMQSFI